MESERTALHALFDEARVACLATLGELGPEASLVPFAVRRDPLRFVLLVSELSPHTSALRKSPRCSLLIRREAMADDPREQHAIERATVFATARFISRDEARAEGVEALWRARFPRVSEMTLPLGDFHFVSLAPTPEGHRYVRGFGRAFHASGGALEHLEHVKGR